jgi:hypothetical protein
VKDVNVIFRISALSSSSLSPTKCVYFIFGIFFQKFRRLYYNKRVESLDKAPAVQTTLPDPEGPGPGFGIAVVIKTKVFVRRPLNSRDDRRRVFIHHVSGSVKG